MNIFQSLLMYFVWFLSTYFVVLFIILIFKYKETLFEKKSEMVFETYPKISIIVPAYNEEKTIAKTLQSLNKIDYPKEKLQIIVINDGSKDKTSDSVNFFKGMKFKFIDNKKNKGKASCLNQGISNATGEFVACMDADTVVEPNILKETLKHFVSDKIGAVIVGVEVKPKNLLQKITQIEYTIGLSLSLSLLSKLGSVHVTPGPFSIYRAKMLREIGGFDPKNITEDLEIAYRIQKNKYQISCCLTTKVYTDVPDNLKSLYKQRRQWYTGSLQTLSQHKDVILNKELGVFGVFIPYNFSLILFGVLLFFVSLIVAGYNNLRMLLFYRYTNFNFLENLKYFEIDLLNIFNIYSILVAISFILTIFMAYIGLKSNEKKHKEEFFRLCWVYILFYIISGFLDIVNNKLCFEEESPVEIDYKIFVAAGIITLALFGLIYVANEIANSQREQKINDMRDEVIDELESIKAFTAISSLIGEEQNCNLIQSQLKYFDKSIWDIGIKLDSYKEASKNIFDDPFYQKQKKRFVVNQVLYLSLLEKMKQTCNTTMPITVLYFYANSKECKLCDDQSFVLTDINRKYDEMLAIFSLDFDMDISATTVLADYYNVSKEKSPCVVIEKSASCGFLDKKQLAEKISNLTGFIFE